MKQRVRTLLQLAVVFALVLSLAPFQAFAQEGMSEKADIVATAIAAGAATESGRCAWCAVSTLPWPLGWPRP